MISRDAHLKEVFPHPPMMAYKRQRNLKDILIQAKVPETQRNPKRTLKGMNKCHKVYCNICPFVKERKSFKMNTKQIWNINKHVNCNSQNVVYMIECDKEGCTEKYIGETKRSLRSRFADHRGYVKGKQTEKATGMHFNLPGHSVTNMKVSIIEQVKYNSDLYRKEREDFYIRRFNTYNEGLNRKV